MKNYIVTVHFAGGLAVSIAVKATNERSACRSARIALAKKQGQKNRTIKRMTVIEDDIPF